MTYLVLHRYLAVTAYSSTGYGANGLRLLAIATL